MTRDQLAEYLEKHLRLTSHTVIMQLVNAIDRALLDAETGVSELELINRHNPSRQIEKALRKALRACNAKVEQEFIHAIEHENNIEAAAAVTVAALLMPSSKHYSQALADKVTLSQRTVQREITTALTKPGFVELTPAWVRFESPNGFYNRVVTQAISDVKNGRGSRQKAVSDACRTLTRSGMRYVNYQSGHTNRIDVAVSRALQSELTHLQGDFAFENAAILGTDLFEVDAHSGARPTHQVWQGKVYTMEELETVCGLGDILGLKGVNCHHQFKPYIKGSKRAWTDAELAKMHAEDNRLKTFGGKEYTTYQARQKQRQMEASMRIQRERIALDPYIDQEKAKAKYSAMRRNYKAFSKAMGEKTHFDRVYTGTI